MNSNPIVLCGARYVRYMRCAWVVVQKHVTQRRVMMPVCFRQQRCEDVAFAALGGVFFFYAAEPRGIQSTASPLCERGWIYTLPPVAKTCDELAATLFIKL